MTTGAKTEALDVRDAGRRIGLGPRAAYRAAERGQIPAVKIGGRWLVPVRAWELFLAGAWAPKPRPVPAASSNGSDAQQAAR